jgi:hypothetical protein
VPSYFPFFTAIMGGLDATKSPRGSIGGAWGLKGVFLPAHTLFPNDDDKMKNAPNPSAARGPYGGQKGASTPKRENKVSQG